jgi:hypothetical protein
MLTPAPAPVRAASAPVLRRKCACGGTPGPSGECEQCRRKRLQRNASAAAPAVAPAIVHDVLRSPGQPLDAGTRAFMEPRFGHSFHKLRVHAPEPGAAPAGELAVGPPHSAAEREAEGASRSVMEMPAPREGNPRFSFADVRVHAGPRAAESARAVGAAAFTVGSSIVFGDGYYAPGTQAGRALLAHELAHVAQGPRGGLWRQTPAAPQPQSAAPQCGPEVSAWFRFELGLWAAYVRKLIRHRAANPTPGQLDKAWDYATMLVVGPQMTYEPTTSFASATQGVCPGEPCARSVTLCGRCVDRSEVGNFLYSWFARDLRMTWLQTYGGSIAGNRGTRSEADVQSVRLGYDYRETPNVEICTFLNDTTSRLPLATNAQRWQGMQSDAPVGCRPCTASTVPAAADHTTFPDFTSPASDKFRVTVPSLVRGS